MSVSSEPTHSLRGRFSRHHQHSWEHARAVRRDRDRRSAHCVFVDAFGVSRANARIQRSHRVRPRHRVGPSLVARRQTPLSSFNRRGVVLGRSDWLVADLDEMVSNRGHAPWRPSHSSGDRRRGAERSRASAHARWRPFRCVPHSAVPCPRPRHPSGLAARLDRPDHRGPISSTMASGRFFGSTAAISGRCNIRSSTGSGGFSARPSQPDFSWSSRPSARAVACAAAVGVGLLAVVFVLDGRAEGGVLPSASLLSRLQYPRSLYSWPFSPRQLPSSSERAAHAHESGNSSSWVASRRAVPQCAGNEQPVVVQLTVRSDILGRCSTRHDSARFWRQRSAVGPRTCVCLRGADHRVRVHGRPGVIRTGSCRSPRIPSSSASEDSFRACRSTPRRQPS